MIANVNTLLCHLEFKIGKWKWKSKLSKGHFLASINRTQINHHSVTRQFRHQWIPNDSSKKRVGAKWCCFHFDSDCKLKLNVLLVLLLFEIQNLTQTILKSRYLMLGFSEDLQFSAQTVKNVNDKFAILPCTNEHS